MESTADIAKVLFVKKVLPGGEPCGKCRDVEARLHKDGLMRHVSEIVAARQDDPSSPGARLAERLGVRRAPFFVVQYRSGAEKVFESYLAFRHWFSGGRSAVDDPTTGDLMETVDAHPDLAFL